jgi:hypothetical protein
MLYAAIDIHKRTFHAAVLDIDSGETVERRFGATREELNDWAMPLQGRLAAVAIEATNGWRWVWRELSARVRRSPNRSGASEGAPRSDQAREDRSTRCALAVRVVGEGDAARVVAATGGDPDAARPDEVAQGVGRGSHPLGAATARAAHA